LLLQVKIYQRVVADLVESVAALAAPQEQHQALCKTAAPLLTQIPVAAIHLMVEGSEWLVAALAAPLVKVAALAAPLVKVAALAAPLVKVAALAASFAKVDVHPLQQTSAAAILRQH
jgi:hypothetical protein